MSNRVRQLVIRVLLWSAGRILGTGTLSVQFSSFENVSSRLTGFVALRWVGVALRWVEVLRP